MIVKSASLTPFVLAVVRDKATESPFESEFNDFGGRGTYLCRQCGLALFRSKSKFHSGCGWPSFDEEISDTVKRQTDQDAMRSEIICARCDAHLGHVFEGEAFTLKNVRHCVNSLSLDFVPNERVSDTEEAIFAGGCFWGVEYYFKKLEGVLKTEVGYTGGHKANPTYNEMRSGNTGHVEALRMIYDLAKITYEELAKYFFEIHDFTQTDGQGPDLGWQYLSVIFYYDENQKMIAEKLISELKEKNYRVATQLLPVKIFWKAETYHQDYYEKNRKKPYCHVYEKKF